MTDIERLTELVRNASEDIEHSDLKAEGLSPEFAPLADAILSCFANIREVYEFTSAIADGNMEANMPQRHNYFAGPSKDLYYKLKHLTWQAEEVAKGDYSQRVDFLGSFSDSFNFMITELEKREQQIKLNADREVKQMEKQNERLRGQLERQMLHYTAYCDYVRSFVEFRSHYKEMMGEIYALFNKQKYEEGRLLIAKINDMMASEVIISKDYSNNDYMNAVLTDIATACRIKEIPFRGSVFMPNSFTTERATIENIADCSELVLSILDIKGHEGQSLFIKSGVKNGWLSISTEYEASSGDFPDDIGCCLNAESLYIIDKLHSEATRTGNLFDIIYQPEKRRIRLNWHICPEVVCKFDGNDPGGTG